MNGSLGWSPHQYVLDSGWDLSCIEATAKNGISDEDAADLTDRQQAALLEYCKERVKIDPPAHNDYFDPA